MTRLLLDIEWLKKLNSYKRAFVGFSGGLDSTVLLHNLLNHSSLKTKLTAVHINHGLSPNALMWQNHCQQFCHEHEIPLIVKQVLFEHNANLEERAREARYSAFSLLIEESDCLILGHHLNDQAETLLLHLYRGAGVDGLAGMSSSKKFAQGQLLRPFLHLSRQDLEDYAQFYHLKWIDDESNQDISFTRNYLRHEVLPLLSQRWPALVYNLVRSAQHCQQAQANLDDLARIDCVSLDQPSMTLAIASLNNLNQARLSNVLRVWLKSNKVKLPGTAIFNRIIQEIIQAKDDANPLITWENMCIKRYQKILYLIKNERKTFFQNQNWISFPEPMIIENLGLICAKRSGKGLVIPEHAQIEIRFRQGGELFNWRKQTKQLKKLFQEWHIPPWERDKIPLLYVNSQLAAVIGYAIADCFYSEKAVEAYQLSYTRDLSKC